MERFMKAVDLIGRSGVELKEYQHSSEINFDSLHKQVGQCVRESDHDSSMENMRNRLESKMNAAFTDFQDQINKLSQKTTSQLDKFDGDLKQVEIDTYWKIKDYEKLLEQRPTLKYV